MKRKLEVGFLIIFLGKNVFLLVSLFQIFIFKKHWIHFFRVPPQKKKISVLAFQNFLVISTLLMMTKLLNYYQ